MTVEQMREDICRVYDNDSWRAQVRRMPDRQVKAIYFNWLENGKCDQPRKQPNVRMEQLSMFDEKGGVIFHTAVSRAGVGPTSSNKAELEGTMPQLTAGGIRMFLGKGELKDETIRMFDEYNAVYAVIAPVTALLNSKVLSQKCLAYPELGMEAFYELKVDGFPAIIAAAHGERLS